MPWFSPGHILVSGFGLFSDKPFCPGQISPVLEVSPEKSRRYLISELIP